MNPLQSTWKNLYLVLEMFFGDFVKEKVSGNSSELKMSEFNFEALVALSQHFLLFIGSGEFSQVLVQEWIRGHLSRGIMYFTGGAQGGDIPESGSVAVHLERNLIMGFYQASAKDKLSVFFTFAKNHAMITFQFKKVVHTLRETNAPAH